MTALYIAIGVAVVLLAAYPLTALALKHAKAEEPEEPVEPDGARIEGQFTHNPRLKGRYVDPPPPDGEFRVVGQLTEATLNGKRYRVRRGDEQWLSRWAEYPSGMYDYGAGCVLADRWKAAQRRKEWGT